MPARGGNDGGMSEYAQASETTAGETAAVAAERASFARRLGAILLDGLLLSVVGAVLKSMLPDTTANGLGVAIGLAYFTYFEGSTGQTLGKRALGIRVADQRGGEVIGFGRAAVRYVGRIVSTLPLFLGYLWMLWDAEKQTWHDKFASSVVVRA